jgi:hypothetical protein
MGRELEGKHYTHCCMSELWKKAFQDAGENIEMYSGLKHSSCSQYVNEKAYSLDEVQMLTDHARRDSVKRYASVKLEAKRRLLEGKHKIGAWMLLTKLTNIASISTPKHVFCKKWPEYFIDFSNQFTYYND